MHDVAAYCRQLEAYLCQKNGGHLIRIVGPAFEQVAGWYQQGIPLKIALRGIDQCCERRATGTGRRRPVRIEFCEADILALFDDWRRAVGVSPAVAAAVDPPLPRRPSLAAHVERAVARLVAVRTGEHGGVPASVIDGIVRELDRIAATARGARGCDRTALVDELSALDDLLMRAASDGLSEEASARLRREAEDELAPFGQRIAPDARAAAAAAAYRRLVRETLRLPRLTFD